MVQVPPQLVMPLFSLTANVLVQMYRYCQQQWATAPLASMFGMSSRSTPKLFDINFKCGEGVQRTGMVFEGQMLSPIVEKGCREAMPCKLSLNIGLPGADVQDFNRKLGVEAAAKRCTAWSILFSQTLSPKIFNLRFAAGGPSKVLF